MGLVSFTEDGRFCWLRQDGAARRSPTGRIPAAVLVLTGGQACDSLAILDAFDGNGACPLWNPPGILIDVVDAGSGRPLPIGAKPTGFAIRGRVRERMTLVSTVPGEDRTQLSGGEGPPGARSEGFMYDVEITAEGYEPWRASGISVEVDNCGHATADRPTACAGVWTPAPCRATVH